MRSASHHISSAIALLLLAGGCLPGSPNTQVTIIDTGSTNRRGVTVTVAPNGSASIEARDERGQRQVKLPASLSNRLFQDLQASGGISSLPVRHCLKSASFGSRLFVEVNGNRSPDLSCPGQNDSHAIALQKDANEILEAAHAGGPRDFHSLEVPHQ